MAWNTAPDRAPETGRDPPLVLAVEGAHGPVIHAVSSNAANLGISAGARVVDMRALVPDLKVADAAPQTDADDLAMLARWTRRWCPWTQVDGAAGLLLDSTGSDHIHGGEEAMVRDMIRAFSAMKLTVRIAIAPTTGAAWALARFSGDQTVLCPSGRTAAQLAPLPVSALRLDQATVLLLGRLGVKTIGALAALPRDALVRRFRRVEALTANPVLRLDQAMGRQEELLVSQPHERPPFAARRMAEPLGDLAGMEQVLHDLLGDLHDVMERRQCGARALRFTAYGVDGAASQACVRIGHASRDTEHLARLFDGKLDRIDPGFGIEAASLEATDTQPLHAAQDDLERPRQDDALAFARLIDRLEARLGPASILGPVSQNSHVPERSEALMPLLDKAAPPARAVRRSGATPLRLLQNPETAEVIHAVPDGPPARFRWRRRYHDVARSAGPERIAPEWWHERPTARLRDYYHVEDSEGRRYWLYREGLADDGRGGNPQWFVHGMDA